MEETWKDIRNYDGFYQISNHGRVRSMDRYIINNGTKILIKGIIKKPIKNSSGYLQVNLYKNGKGKRFYIHRLVALHFFDYYGEDVNHKDGIKINNNAINLEWVSKKENHFHAIENKFIKRNKLGQFIKKEEFEL